MALNLEWTSLAETENPPPAQGDSLWAITERITMLEYHFYHIRASKLIKFILETEHGAKSRNQIKEYEDEQALLILTNYSRIFWSSDTSDADMPYAIKNQRKAPKAPY